MKINPKKLAVGLYEITRGKDKREIDIITKRLVKFLAQNGSLNLSSKLTNEYCNYYNKTENILDVEVITSRLLSEAQKEKFVGKLNDTFKKKINAEFKTDEDLIGGFVIKTQDCLLDGSLLKSLKSLNKK